jgi:hypothetical protein
MATLSRSIGATITAKIKRARFAEYEHRTAEVRTIPVLQPRRMIAPV